MLKDWSFRLWVSFLCFPDCVKLLRSNSQSVLLFLLFFLPGSATVRRTGAAQSGAAVAEVCWSRAAAASPEQGSACVQKRFEFVSQMQGRWTERNREIPEIFHVQADISSVGF